MEGVDGALLMQDVREELTHLFTFVGLAKKPMLLVQIVEGSESVGRVSFEVCRRTQDPARQEE